MSTRGGGTEKDLPHLAPDRRWRLRCCCGCCCDAAAAAASELFRMRGADDASAAKDAPAAAAAANTGCDTGLIRGNSPCLVWESCNADAHRAVLAGDRCFTQHKQRSYGAVRSPGCECTV